MAVKPTAVFTLATNPVYTAGAFLGSPTRVIFPDVLNGMLPGTGVAASHINYGLGITGDWLTDWLQYGSALATLDAHIVETDPTGHSAIGSLELGGTAGVAFALEVSSNAGAPAEAILVTNNHGGFAMLANNTSASATVKAQNSGTGYCYDGTNLGTGGGINLVALSTGRGVNVTSVNGDGVHSDVSGTGHGGYFRAGGTGRGVIAYRQPTGGPAGSFHTDGAAAPLRGILNCEPGVEPTAPVDGDIWVEGGTAGFGRGSFRWYDADGSPGGGGPGFQKAFSSATGIGYFYAATEASSTEAAGVLTTKTTLTLDASGSPGQGQGKYVCHWSCEVELDAGAALTTRCYIEFQENGMVISTANIDFVAVGQPKTVTCMKEVTLGAGIIPLTIKFKTTSAPDGVNMQFARISAQGAYE